MGGGAGSFAVLVLVLGLLCICATVIRKKRRVKGRIKLHSWSRINIYFIIMPLHLFFILWVKVSAIRSRVLERNGLTMNRGSDTRNEKGTNKHP